MTTTESVQQYAARRAAEFEREARLFDTLSTDPRRSADVRLRHAISASVYRMVAAKLGLDAGPVDVRLPGEATVTSSGLAYTGD